MADAVTLLTHGVAPMMVVATYTPNGGLRCGHCGEPFARGITPARKDAAVKCGWCRVWNRLELPDRTHRGR